MPRQRCGMARHRRDPCVKIEGARQDRRARGAAGRRGRSSLHRATSGDPAGSGDRGARPGVRGRARGLHAALPRLWRGRRAHGGAGGRGATRRGVHHGRMHRADRRTCGRSGADAASSTCCTTAIQDGCPPRATWRSPSRRRRFRWGRRIGSTFTICCGRRIPTRCFRWRSRRCRFVPMAPSGT